MKKIQLEDIKKIVKSNSVLAIGGFTFNRKPISIIKEIAKSDVKNLSLFLLAGSLDVDLLINKNKLKKISAAYVGYEGLGLSKLTRKAVESKKIAFEDLSEILYYFRLKAGAMGVSFIPTKALVNSDISKINSACKKIKDPFTGDILVGIKSLNPDVCIIHAQKADNEGNILIDEPDCSEKEMAQASKMTIVSVEKIGKIKSNQISIPKEFVNYVIVSKKGAYPTGCAGYYNPDIKELLKYLENK